MFKIILNNCCGLDVHKTWIYACVGITDSHNQTHYHEARFTAFSKGLRDLCGWLAKLGCTQVCMESAGKYWIPVFNILEKTCRVNPLCNRIPSNNILNDFALFKSIFSIKST